MSETHYQGQRLYECECGRTIRLKPERISKVSVVTCGQCERTEVVEQ